jgi:hypothetical protein
MLKTKMPNHTEVATTLRYAKGIAFDGCHKIYICMDDEQVSQMRSYGYGDKDTYLITATATPEQLLTVIQGWWDNSCGLRFIEAVSTRGDETDFHTLIGQGEDEEDEEN